MPGGVCAKLDYETDMMADYVADMATRIVLPRSTVTPAFRKFVNQILTSTRLPSTTILLGMNYLAKHVNTHKQAGTYKTATEGELWKMLTVALLLGSKFLDDNTFQNRSWSDVSGISVIELNTMENRWLRDIDWSLYVNLDRSLDYDAWLTSWKQYKDNKRQALQQQQSQNTVRERLAPIVTTVHNESLSRSRYASYDDWTPEEYADHDRVPVGSRYGRPGKYSYRPQDGGWSGQYQNTWSQTPVTPPDSGYGTPEYLNSAASVNSQYNDWLNQAFANGNYGSRGFSSSGHHNYSSSRNGCHYHHQPYLHQFGQNSWDANVTECNCNQCVSAIHNKAAPGFHHHVYGQPVMGQ
ncbi:hypothetical protein F5Y16DRAFT_186345 [Xylariaceae sp. FL0255]|nr:hypothetical protein F5Y16DRAFT_186345 [Xylariaceae sp. FL0255]